MLHQCGHHSGGGMAHPCSCGLYYGACSGGGGGSAFSFLFPMAGNKPAEELPEAHYPIPSSSSVDCTLSLGTPSTRQTDASTTKPTSSNPIPSSMCWDIISQSSKMGSKAASGSNGSSCSNLGGDPVLLARRCANCDTTSTPLWRNGPRGPKSLCNACGIRYKKEERRMLASSTTAASPSTSVEKAVGYGYHSQQPWSGYGSTVTASRGSYGEESAEDGELPYLSWRLNVVPSAQIPVRDLFQYN